MLYITSNGFRTSSRTSLFYLLVLLTFLGTSCDLGKHLSKGDVEEEDSAELDSSSSEDTVTSGGDYATLGESCDGAVDCGQGLVCFPYPQGYICSERCSESDVFCDQGEYCIGLQGLDYGACLAYGQGGEAATCENHWDCAKGMVCVTNEVGDTGCDYACDFLEEVAKCPEGRYCSYKPGISDFGLCSKPTLPY